eukprot:TRINITY_DN8891_c0_g1_i1.p1 TRINITY_DN8891_c0_g1~~TRINITY_DN8891_c0_g1_i1.p1  ORF type:complete len:545 (-),score=72.68 TRINITY_DN8891_c0_g1_i1:26-1660(-)
MGQENQPHIQVELHRHLEGSCRLSSVVEEYIAQNPSKQISDDARGNFNHPYWRSMFLIDHPVDDLTLALKKFECSQQLLASEEIVERIAFECCEDAHNEGTKLLEIRYSPDWIQKGHEHLTFQGIHEAVVRGVQRAKDEYGISVGIIGILDRSMSYKHGSEVMDFVLANRQTFVGVDLANDEVLFDGASLAPLFQIAKRNGIHVTAHAGESINPIFAKSVRFAIDKLGAERIGHGIATITDENLIKHVIEKDVLLEISPVSNSRIKAVTTLNKHPIKQLMEKGCEDAHNEGTKLLEIRYSPDWIQKGHEHLTFQGIHEAVVRGVQRAKDEYGISVGIIGILDRSMSYKHGSEVMDFVLANRQTFVGVDLANDEVLFDGASLAPLFQIAKRNGIHVTAHAGESINPIFAKSVRFAIDKLGAERIGHGIATITDENLIKHVIEKDVLLEISPVSNSRIKAVTTLNKHPIKQLMEKGVKVSISSDDPGIFDSNLTHQHTLLRSELGFTDEQFRMCDLHGFQHSFLPEDEKQQIINKASKQREALLYD